MFSVLLGMYLRSGIAGSQGNFVFNLLINCQTVFQSVTILFYILTSHIPVSHKLTIIFHCGYFLLDILVGVK